MALIDFKGLLKGGLSALERALIKALDENVSQVGKQWLKDEAGKLIDSNYDKVFHSLRGKVRNLIDKLDGEANLPPDPMEKPAAAPAADGSVAPGI